MKNGQSYCMFSGTFLLLALHPIETFSSFHLSVSSPLATTCAVIA
jgi:hypothetical protein